MADFRHKVIRLGGVFLFAAALAFPAFAADKDGDGMGDDWESANGLDYTDPTDAGEDPDYDNLTNVEEFGRKGDPQDSDSPERTYYVAKTGSNSNSGIRKAPWLTISHALSRLRATASSRVRIVVGGGVYEENLQLAPYVLITGYYTVPTGPDSKARPTYSGIIGNHIGAAGAALKDLYLSPKVTTAPILKISDVSMVVTNCVFAGPGFDPLKPNAGIGISVLTDDAIGTLIEKTDFKGLDKGIVVEGDFPLIRQCFFEDIDDNAISLVSGRTFGTINLGKADDPTTGFNSFDINSIGGPIISGNWLGNLQMENNTWNTVDLDLIDTVLSGGLDDFDFDPPGNTTTYSLIPASIFCTVTNGESDVRVEDALILIQPAIFAPVSDNLEGVYAIPAVLPGSYTVQALAPNYESQSKTVNIQQSEIEAVLFELDRFSSADMDQSNTIGLTELLRLIQFYNTGSFHCQDGSEDGFAPGNGSHNCTPHTSDYSPQNWAISLGEILRAIQFYNTGGYSSCPEDGTEDGFCPN
jgi:hypothetical protein